MPRFQALTLAALSCLHATTASAYPRQDASVRTEYDYIIVGAGASGLTVANRLSEDSGAFCRCIGRPCLLTPQQL